MKKPLMKWGSVWSGLSVAMVLVGVAVAYGQTATPQKPPSMMVDEGPASAMMAQRTQMRDQMMTMDDRMMGHMMQHMMSMQGGMMSMMNRRQASSLRIS